MAFNLEKNQHKVEDIKKNIETKKGELQNLENNKQKMREAGMEIQAANLDDKVKKIAMEGVNQEMVNISEKGKEIASEMMADIVDIENFKQETQEAIGTNETEKKKLEQKKGLLDKLGLGKGIDTSINELDNNQKNLDAFNNTLMETGKELDRVHQKLNGL